MQKIHIQTDSAPVAGKNFGHLMCMSINILNAFLKLTFSMKNYPMHYATHHYTNGNVLKQFLNVMSYTYLVIIT